MEKRLNSKSNFMRTCEFAFAMSAGKRGLIVSLISWRLFLHSLTSICFVGRQESENYYKLLGQAGTMSFQFNILATFSFYKKKLIAASYCLGSI